MLTETYYLLGRVNYIERNNFEAVKILIDTEILRIFLNTKMKIILVRRSLFEINDNSNGCLVMQDIIFLIIIQIQTIYMMPRLLLIKKIVILKISHPL